MKVSVVFEDGVIVVDGVARDGFDLAVTCSPFFGPSEAGKFQL